VLKHFWEELLSQDQDNACFEIQSFEFLTGVVFQHTLPTLLFTTKFLIELYGSTWHAEYRPLRA
jgi:hypothetical protein